MTMPGQDPKKKRRERDPWQLTKEKILMTFGIIVVAAELIRADIWSKSPHYEFILAGLALCGISITSWGDRR